MTNRLISSSMVHSRLGSAIRNNQKKGIAIDELGCSVAELKGYIQNEYGAEFAWNKRGIGPGKWKLRRIIPLEDADLDDPEVYKKLAHYTNLHPVWNGSPPEEFLKYLTDPVGQLPGTDVYPSAYQEDQAKLRTSVHAHIERMIYTQSSCPYLECNYRQLKDHIESQFEVNWKNLGRTWRLGWIQPLETVDLREETPSYTNLEPKQ